MAIIDAIFLLLIDHDDIIAIRFPADDFFVFDALEVVFHIGFECFKVFPLDCGALAFSRSFVGGFWNEINVY
jgi:hypothetical protein